MPGSRRHGHSRGSAAHGHGHAHGHAHPSERSHHRPSAAESMHRPGNPHHHHGYPSYSEEDRFQPPGHQLTDREYQMLRHDMLRAGYTEEEIDMSESDHYYGGPYGGSGGGGMSGHGHGYGGYYYY